MRDQAATLRRKLELAQNPRQAKTISIVSGKGGVGKSNVALNFSLELINKQKKVLLFDLDVGMGNIDILLGLHAEKTIVDMFTDQLSIHDIIETGPKRLSYISAGSGLSDFFTMDQTKSNYFLAQYEELVPMYDYIIFDMGAGATNDSIFFIIASNECIVVTTPEPTSITDAYGMIKHIVHKQPDMPIAVIMNRSASYKNGKRALERFQGVISRFLNVDIQAAGILPDDKTVSTAVIRQIPFILLNEKAPISKAMKQITSNYTASSGKLKEQQPFTFAQKLKQLLIER